MKFLVDRCAGQRLAAWLKNQGYDVLESRELGSDPGDRVLLKLANKEHRILVTLDKDFGEFVFLENTPHSGLVRLPDVPSDVRVSLMDELLSKYGKELEQRAVITVRGGRIRISRKT